jgi:hypothetical protein
MTTTGRVAVRVRTGASIVAAFVLAVGLSACSVFNTPHTQKPYDSSDGVSVTVGDVRVLNAIVFTDDGENGNFFAAVANSGDSDVDLALQYQSGGEKVDITVEVPSGETVYLGGTDGQVYLPGIDATPGSLLAIYFQYGDTPGKQIDVPVLDTALEQYDDLLPTPTPTPTPTVTATPEPAPTP